ncbi:MAG: hypothetical protein ACR2HK_11830 [Gemmatimonadales bacterium]
MSPELRRYMKMRGM